MRQRRWLRPAEFPRRCPFLRRSPHFQHRRLRLDRPRFLNHYLRRRSCFRRRSCRRRCSRFRCRSSQRRCPPLHCPRGVEHQRGRRRCCQEREPPLHHPRPRLRPQKVRGSRGDVAGGSGNRKAVRSRRTRPSMRPKGAHRAGTSRGGWAESSCPLRMRCMAGATQIRGATIRTHGAGARHPCQTAAQTGTPGQLGS